MSSRRQQPLRRRLACDRCHSFKLKCPRTSLDSDDACTRCLKAGVACLYSPSMRGQIRAKQASYVTPTSITPIDSFNEMSEGGIALPSFDAHGICFFPAQSQHLTSQRLIGHQMIFSIAWLWIGPFRRMDFYMRTWNPCHKFNCQMISIQATRQIPVVIVPTRPAMMIA